MNKKEKLYRCGNQTELWIYIPAYLMSYFLAKTNYHYLSGAVLILTAMALYGIAFHHSGNLVDLEGLFSLSWIGGQGIACFQLSKLQQDWSRVTWMCFFLAYLCFHLGYRIQIKKRENINVPRTEQVIQSNDMQAKRIYFCCIALTIASILCFTLEAVVVGYIPLFSKLPHAYSYFHISGVHYFTISCILIPGLTVVYSKVAKTKEHVAVMMLVLCNLVAVAIPILCVSRFQLIFAIGFALVVYIAVYRKIQLKMILILLFIMVPLYILLTFARHHDVTYLNSIFEMKNSQIPIGITQPYMYIVNNYENFNCMVEQLITHTYGLKMLFPFFALTGLKFIFPQLIAFPMYVTKKELTTLTMFYDAYYDFGVIGMIGFSFLLGYVVKKISDKMRTDDNPIIYLIYGQIAVYLALSFFTTWFSNPTTWFWLVLTVMMYLFVGYQKKEKQVS